MTKKIVIFGGSIDRLGFFEKLLEITPDEKNKATLERDIHRCKQSLTSTGAGFIVLHHGDERIQLHIVSTQDRFQKMFPTYIKNASVAIALGDANQFPSQISALQSSQIPTYLFTDNSNANSIFQPEIDLPEVELLAHVSTSKIKVLILGDEPARKKFYETLRTEFTTNVNLAKKIEECELLTAVGLGTITIRDLQFVILPSSTHLERLQILLNSDKAIPPKAIIHLDTLDDAHIKEALKHPEIPLLSFLPDTSIMALIREIRDLPSYEEAKMLRDETVRGAPVPSPTTSRAADIWASLFKKSKQTQEIKGPQDWQNPRYPRPRLNKDDDDDKL